MNATTLTTTPAQRTAARLAAGATTRYGRADNTVSVRVIDGAMPPKLLGESFRFTTRTGLPVHNPKAYARKGWSSLVYHSSTRRVVVGSTWLATHAG